MVFGGVLGFFGWFGGFLFVWGIFRGVFFGFCWGVFLLWFVWFWWFGVFFVWFRFIFWVWGFFGWFFGVVGFFGVFFCSKKLLLVPRPSLNSVLPKLPLVLVPFNSTKAFKPNSSLKKIHWERFYGH